MDDLDRKLLSMLRRDARTSVADLAKALAVSRGTVLNRMRRLEAERVIRGYTIKLASDHRDTGIRAWVCIRIEGPQSRRVIDALLGDPAVSTLHDTNGRWDLLAEIVVPGMAELSAALDRIRMVRGVSGTETNIHLTTFR
ncbi:MAG: Lrp/AsnC family transcriptional regulator [Alsobacter sp.]